MLQESDHQLANAPSPNNEHAAQITTPAGDSSSAVFERYFTVWVLLCVVIGVALGQVLPTVFPVV